MFEADKVVVRILDLTEEVRNIAFWEEGLSKQPEFSDNEYVGLLHVFADTRKTNAQQL